MFNKPAGCITARADEVHPTVMDYFPPDMRKAVFPVGRLDKDTTGLLLFTDDGSFDQKLMHPKHHVSKTYMFYAVGSLSEEQIKELEGGVLLKGEEKITSPCSITVLDTMLVRDIKDFVHLPMKMKDNPYNFDRAAFKAEITVSEGRKHLIKRLMFYCGCRVVWLERTQIGALKLDAQLERGSYRELTKEEYHMLID